MKRFDSIFKTSNDTDFMKNIIVNKFNEIKHSYFSVRETMFQYAKTNKTLEDESSLKYDIIKVIFGQYEINEIIGHVLYSLFTTETIDEYMDDVYSKNQKLFSQDWTSVDRSDNINKFLNEKSNYICDAIKDIIAKPSNSKDEEYYRKFSNIYSESKYGIIDIEFEREDYYSDVSTDNDINFTLTCRTLNDLPITVDSSLMASMYSVFCEVRSKVVSTIKLIDIMSTLLFKHNNYCKYIQGYLINDESIVKTNYKVSLYIDDDNYYYGIDEINIDNNDNIDSYYDVFVPNFDNLEFSSDLLYKHTITEFVNDKLVDDSIVESDVLNYNNSSHYSHGDCNIPELYITSIREYQRLPTDEDIVELNDKMFNDVSDGLKIIYDNILMCECEKEDTKDNTTENTEDELDNTEDSVICARYVYNMDDFNSEYEPFYFRYYDQIGLYF